MKASASNVAGAQRKAQGHRVVADARQAQGKRSPNTDNAARRGPALREWPGIVLGLVAAVLAIAQFFLPDLPVVVKGGIALGVLIVGVDLSFRWPRQWPFATALIVVLASACTVLVVARPTAAQKYVRKYLAETQSANIWYGNAAMNPLATDYILHHFSAFDPRSIAYPYDLPGAKPVELEMLVRGMPMGNVSGPIVTLGQVAAVSMVGVEPGEVHDPEYVVQLLPITRELSKIWQPKGIGEGQIRDSTGNLSELYPTSPENQVNDGIDVYVRIHPRPMPIPQNGDAMVVRGYPIAFGKVPTTSGHLFDTLYLAGSSAIIYSRG